ncbi:MAG: hypothetical protein ACE5JM_18025 [Armatimonadota bacterium]
MIHQASKLRWLLLSALLTGISAMPSSAGEGASKVELALRETPVAKILPGLDRQSVVITPDRMHAAYVTEREDKWRVVFDGAEGREYDRIDAANLLLSPEGGRIAYLAERGGRPVIVDGPEEREHERLATYSLCMSADGRHVAYAAARGARGTLVHQDGHVLHYHLRLGSGQCSLRVREHHGPPHILGREDTFGVRHRLGQGGRGANSHEQVHA